MSTESETTSVRSVLGKWAQKGVPHLGWTCTQIYDLGERSEICEMCERVEIRYVHVMEHSDYPEPLGCGCVCAGHMEGDLAAARSRDRAMSSRASKRARFLSRKWRVSGKGNDWLVADGYHVVVYQKSNGRWKARLTEDTDEDTSGGPYWTKACATSDQAKLAAFDRITQLLTEAL